MPADNPEAQGNEPNYNLIALHGSTEFSAGQTGQQCSPSITAMLMQLGYNPPHLVKVKAVANARRYKLYVLAKQQES